MQLRIRPLVARKRFVVVMFSAFSFNLLSLSLYGQCEPGFCVYSQHSLVVCPRCHCCQHSLVVCPRCHCCCPSPSEGIVRIIAQCTVVFFIKTNGLSLLYYYYYPDRPIGSTMQFMFDEFTHCHLIALLGRSVETSDISTFPRVLQRSSVDIVELAKIHGQKIEGFEATNQSCAWQRRTSWSVKALRIGWDWSPLTDDTPLVDLVEENPRIFEQAFQIAFSPFLGFAEESLEFS